MSRVLAVDGNYSPWSDWNPCTVTCGGGETMRTRQCSNPAPGFGGKDCSSLGASTETTKCRKDPCPGKSQQLDRNIIILNKHKHEATTTNKNNNFIHSHKLQFHDSFLPRIDKPNRGGRRDKFKERKKQR